MSNYNIVDHKECLILYADKSSNIADLVFLIIQTIQTH